MPTTTTLSNALATPRKLDLAQWRRAVPVALQRGTRWCGWKGERPDGKADKAPRNLRTGEHARTDDPSTFGNFEEACRWYEKHLPDPNAGAGIVTGDGLGAIDYDDARGPAGTALPWALLGMRDLDRATYVEVSPSGKGFHAFVMGADGMVEFKPGKEPSSCRPHQFVTVTGLRRHDAQPDVKEAPERFRPLFAANEPTREPAPVTPLPRTSAQHADDLARLYDALPVVVEHYRAHGITYEQWTQHVVAPLQGTFQGTALWPAVKALFADLTRRIPGYLPGDEQKLEDFHRTDGALRTVASIFHDADHIDGGAWRRKREAKLAEADAVDVLPSGLDAGETLYTRDLPPLTFAIRPYLPKGEVVEVHGPHGQFKSTLLLYAALSVASGTPWNGGAAPKEPGRAAFISLEDRSDTIARRVRTWTAGLSHGEEAEKVRRKAVSERFQYLGREKAAVLALTKLAYGETRVRREVVEWLVKACDGVDLLVLETSLRLSPGPEDNTSLAILAFALEEVATRTGTTVVLVRHVPKDQGRSGRVDSYGGRGGGSLADAARGVLSVVRDGDGADAPVRIVHTKSTHTAPGPDLLWAAVPSGDGVFLTPLVGAAVDEEDERKVLDHLAEAGAEGMLWRDLRDSVRGGKGAPERRHALRAALDRLVAAGKVRREQDGKTDRYFLGSSEVAA